ncbi:hypothetical protein [Nocardioides sp. CFH 31398]|uniref:hypothetical protein n=1 Tax=Nocardioides sp. CFH 31398 TaxID=2919579 RepID=UPI001F05B296|nr:hypothetical protein [Nocardioides sp. CFH 31398]MCH1865212.1 hypothetical protein [Nocardioides sp. CFH 31398]
MGWLGGLGLALYALTMLAGLALWRHTTEVGRPESGGQTSNLPPLLLFVHPLLAFGGAITWTAYVVLDEAWLAWTTLGWLVLGVAVGELLFVRTLRSRRQKVAAPIGPEPDQHVAENAMTLPGIALHGVLALLLVVVVLVAALTS